MSHSTAFIPKVEPSWTLEEVVDRGVLNLPTQVRHSEMLSSPFKAARLSFRPWPKSIYWRCLSSAAPNQTIQLAYDLHLPPSKAQYSPSQQTPAIILMHGVHPSLITDIAVVWFENIIAHTFATISTDDSNASVHHRSPQSRRLDQTGRSTTFIPTHGQRRRTIHPWPQSQQCCSRRTFHVKSHDSSVEKQGEQKSHYTSPWQNPTSQQHWYH
jgi:hypothetical protein